MPPGLLIPDDLAFRALAWAAQQRFESVDVESVKLLKATQAAKLLGIPTPAFRRLAADHIDFGEKTTRWSLKDIKALIEKRRVKARS